METDLVYGSCPEGATHRLLLLHGWGADADDLIPLGEELSKGLIGITLELVAFRAPQKHPDGCGRQWYGLFPPDWAEVPFAINDLQSRIKCFSRSSLPINKTVILGFSQGGAMALSAGLDLPMAGVIGCSAYPHPNWSPPKKAPPILLTHGIHDEVVPCEASKKMIRELKNNQLDADLIEFDGGHQIPSQVFPIIQAALQKWLI